MMSLSDALDDAHFAVRCLRYRLRTERLEISTLLRLALRGATVLDIGANKGIYCFWMRRAVGGSGRVVAFEPQPELHEALLRRKTRFGWANLEVLNLALSDGDGKQRLARANVGDGSASLETSRWRGADDVIAVPAARLDALPADLFAGLKFIKCDVEGHEHAVFAGAEETLRRHRPVVQFESAATGERGRLFEFFRGMNYSGVMLLGGRYLPYTNPEAVPHYKFGLGGYRDFLFFPAEAVGTTIPPALARQFPEAALRF